MRGSKIKIENIIQFEPSEILSPSQRDKSQAFLVNSLRKAIFDWRNKDYPNVTKTTKRLLEFWFKEDHIVAGEIFKFWFAQREAIETLIYIYEVLGKRKFVDLAADFGEGSFKYDPKIDKYPLYAFKMATGSGKTFVMAFSIVWSYFNCKKENDNDYTSKFLVISPNVIVYERLKRDFAEGKIFKEWPFIPPEWQDDFQLKVILREDPLRFVPEDVLFLTNIQQLEERKTKKQKTEEQLDKIFGIERFSKDKIHREDRIKDVLTNYPNVMILKDEAHHIYSLDKAWKKILVNIHEGLTEKFGKGINMELDFSATPKDEKGNIFAWTICDFTLKEAIIMGVVKLPLKGKIKRARGYASVSPKEQYSIWLNAGIERWREYNKQLKELSKKSVLFVQCENNKMADDIYSYLNSLPDLRGKILLIHTDSTGEVKKSDLPELREKAKNIDSNEAKEMAIVSTMMLNEGWDVRNVNIIVGLRAFSAERNILPEQVIGRGLRKMFPELNPNPDKCINSLEIIGNDNFLSLVNILEKEENLKLPAFDITEPVILPTIFVDPKKKKYDIEIPILTPKIIKKEPILDSKLIKSLPSLRLPLEKNKTEIIYQAEDIIKGAEMIKRKWRLPVPRNSGSVIAYYADIIRRNLKLPSSFADFYPLVKEYVMTKLFNEKVDLDDPNVLYTLSSLNVQTQLVNLFVEKFKDLTFIEQEVQNLGKIRLSGIKPFVWTKLVYPANKCIFNYVPCDNNLEIDFSKWLDNAQDVKAFIKIVPRLGFFLEYKSEDNLLRSYYPDFIVKTSYGYYLVETKGLKGSEVDYKDKRATQWCEDATKLSNQKWDFIRINQDQFYILSSKTNSFKELISAIK
jgi:type III restriction enzyme